MGILAHGALLGTKAPNQINSPFDLFCGDAGKFHEAHSMKGPAGTVHDFSELPGFKDVEGGHHFSAGDMGGGGHSGGHSGPDHSMTNIIASQLSAQHAARGH